MSKKSGNGNGIPAGISPTPGTESTRSDFTAVVSAANVKQLLAVLPRAPDAAAMPLPSPCSSIGALFAFCCAGSCKFNESPCACLVCAVP
jgi:hypothetical protein